MTKELRCICHVPPPEGTIRIEIRKPKEGEWFWSDDANEWMKAELDFENLGLPVAIIAPQYIYPTSVEVLEMLKSGKPIDCQIIDPENSSEWYNVICSGVRVESTHPFFISPKWVSKIRIPKPNQ